MYHCLVISPQKHTDISKFSNSSKFYTNRLIARDSCVCVKNGTPVSVGLLTKNKTKQNKTKQKKTLTKTKTKLNPAHLGRTFSNASIYEPPSSSMLCFELRHDRKYMLFINFSGLLQVIFTLLLLQAKVTFKIKMNVMGSGSP